MSEDGSVEETKRLLQEAIARHDWVAARAYVDRLYTLDPAVSVSDRRTLLDLVAVLQSKDAQED